MARIRALLLKELWDHGLVLVGVAVSLGAIWLILLLAAAIGPRTITVLEAHATFVRIFLPLFGLALGHRLVVREWHGRTQRYLEALPLRRRELVAVKYALGLGLLGAAACGSLAVIAAVAAIREPVDAPWIGLILGRTLAFTLALWGFFFAMGMLGRWRVPLYVALFLGVLVIDQSTDLELSRFGPIALVGDTFVLERRVMPWGDVGVTLALALGFAAVGAALALVREGSVAEAMAKTMSLREKAAVGLAVVAALVVLEIADPRRTEAPFAFDREEVAARPDDAVFVLYLEPRHAASAEALADALAEDRSGLADALGMDAPLPPLHVALRPTLEPHEVERVALDDEEDGVLLRAPFTHDDFDAEPFRAVALARALDATTDGRASFEPNAWVRDAVAGWWVRRAGPSARVRALAAFVAREAPPEAETLRRWHRIEERFGDEAARAYATSVAHALIDAAGEERWLAFARDVLDDDPPWGVAAVIEARRAPVFARLEATTSVDEDALASRWSAWLEAHPPAEPLPALAGWTRVDADEGDLRAVRWGVRGANDPGATCALLHAPLGPFDRPVPENELAREEAPCASLGSEGAVLLGRYGPGERALFAIEVHHDAVGGPLRVHAVREAIE